MKKTNLVLLALTLVFICTSCAPAVQTPEEAAADSASRYYFTDAEKVCYITQGKGVVINTIGGTDTGLKKRRHHMVIPAGRQRLFVEWYSGSGWHAGPASITFDFKEGQGYSVGYSSEPSLFYIEHLTDPELIEHGRLLMEQQKIFRQNKR